MSDKLNPCGCGNQDIETLTIYAGTPDVCYCAECSSCHAQGPADPRKTVAIARWNSQVKNLALTARVEELEKAAWLFSRGLIGGKGYCPEELKRKFWPYLETGNTVNLSPREVRLLETIVSAGSRVVDVERKLAEANDKLQWVKRYAVDWVASMPAKEEDDEATCALFASCGRTLIEILGNQVGAKKVRGARG